MKTKFAKTEKMKRMSNNSTFKQNKLEDLAAEEAELVIE